MEDLEAEGHEDRHEENRNGNIKKLRLEKII